MPHPERVGAYRVLRVLGEGGFGVVYEGEQTEPVRRRVAVKVIKPGMDSHAVIARFEAERQALAVMDHPCIAKVFDGGLTERGLPYFVMELVKGEPISDFCDRERMTIEERLELMIPVCEAVQHAHNKGVVHRDLKPGNILVGFDGDGRAMPKIIDFGVAKALNQRLTDKSVFTEQGQLIGTPEYMSPEQAEMSGLDIDTRTDVYSLGVVLYELLTGMLPFDVRALRGAMYGEMQRIIREVEPAKPSTRLSSALHEAGERGSAVEAAKRRRIGEAELPRCLRGDLDWVVMKCLEKDRGRRYGTASGLAADLRRHLRSEPVEAGPPGAGYRVSKFARRHRAGVLTAGALSVVLVGAAVVSSWFAVMQARARRVAEAERRSAQAVASFLADDLLAQAAPAAAGRDMRVIDLLDAARERLDAQTNLGQREERAVRRAIGQAYLALGQEERAEEQLARAVALSEGVIGGGNADGERVLLAEALYRQGRHPEALALAERVIAGAGEGTDTTGADPVLLAGAWGVKASCLKRMKRYAESRDAYERALAMHAAVEGADGMGVWTTRYNLALLDVLEGRPDRAADGLGRVVAAYERIGPAAEASWLNAAGELARVHSDAGRYAQAEPLYEAVLEKSVRLLGEDGRRTVLTRVNLAMLRLKDGRAAQAVPLLTEALASSDRRAGASSEEAAQVVKRLAEAMTGAGDAAGAERVLGERLPGFARDGLVGVELVGELAERLEGLRLGRAGAGAGGAETPDPTPN